MGRGATQTRVDAGCARPKSTPGAPTGSEVMGLSTELMNIHEARKAAERHERKAVKEQQERHSMLQTAAASVTGSLTSFALGAFRTRVDADRQHVLGVPAPLVI